MLLLLHDEKDGKTYAAKDMVTRIHLVPRDGGGTDLGVLVVGGYKRIPSRLLIAIEACTSNPHKWPTKWISEILAE